MKGCRIKERNNKKYPHFVFGQPVFKRVYDGLVFKHELSNWSDVPISGDKNHS